MRLAIQILSFITALIGKLFRPETFLLVVSPFAFINPHILIHHNPKTLLLAIVELPIIGGLFVLFHPQCR